MIRESWLLHVADPCASAGRAERAHTATSCCMRAMRGASTMDFSGLCLGRASGAHLAIALRATAAWRSKIPGWEPALAACIDILVSEGADAREVLAGLL